MSAQIATRWSSISLPGYLWSRDAHEDGNRILTDDKSSAFQAGTRLKSLKAQGAPIAARLIELNELKAHFS